MYVLQGMKKTNVNVRANEIVRAFFPFFQNSSTSIKINYNNSI